MTNLTPSGTVPPSGVPASGVRSQAWSALQRCLGEIKTIFDDIHGTAVVVLPFLEQIESQFAANHPGGSGVRPTRTKGSGNH